VTNPIVVDKLVPWGEMTARQQDFVEGGSGVLLENMITSPQRARFLAHWVAVSIQRLQGVDVTVDEVLDTLTFDDMMRLIEKLPDDMAGARPPDTAPTGAPPAASNGSAKSLPSPTPSAARLPKSSTPTPS
jgi:hypothetical protein